MHNKQTKDTGHEKRTPGDNMEQIINRRYPFSVLPRTITVCTGLGAGASTSVKNHPLSGTENRWFGQSENQVALFARLQFML